MKKQSILWVGIVVVGISCLSELALSVIEREQWSNYSYSWEVQWNKTAKKKTVKNTDEEIAVCSGNQLISKGK